MGDRSQSITIGSTMESDWPQIRGLRIENATDNPSHMEQHSTPLGE
jgi:hypothetical protein